MCSGTKEAQKKLAAIAAAGFIRDGMTIGIGTGTTVSYFIQELGAQTAAGLKIKAVATSESSQKLASSCGISVCLPEEVSHIDLAIDGVDEIDSGFCAVKGGGGALLREKIVASRADKVIWIMDESKLVTHLGSFPLPVEVLPFGYSWAADKIKEAGGHAVLREKNGQIFVTDNGNYIMDVTFDKGVEYQAVSRVIRQIPGVVETGFFGPLCNRIMVGTDTGVREIINSYEKA